MTHDAPTAGGSAPIIGITADIAEEKYQVGRAYVAMVTRAGGAPVIIPCEMERLDEYLRVCGAFILTGGDDPDMTPWGEATHPKATPMDPQRQAFETALLERLDARPRVPVLGVCLGMQLMGLHAGGRLDQHLPDTLASASDHLEKGEHAVTGELGEGIVNTHHHQAITDPGSLRVVATSPDGVIEAIRADDRTFYLGVQWHAERTDDEALGIGLIRQLVECARSDLPSAAVTT